MKRLAATVLLRPNIVDTMTVLTCIDSLAKEQEGYMDCPLDVEIYN